MFDGPPAYVPCSYIANYFNSTSTWQHIFVNAPLTIFRNG